MEWGCRPLPRWREDFQLVMADCVMDGPVGGSGSGFCVGLNTDRLFQSLNKNKPVVEESARFCRSDLKLMWPKFMQLNWNN